jgi:hypothetical protein
MTATFSQVRLYGKVALFVLPKSGLGHTERNLSATVDLFRPGSRSPNGNRSVSDRLTGIGGGMTVSQRRHLTCTPYGDRVKQGDSAVCDGETSDGKKGSVLVALNSNGSYIWEPQ